MWPGAMGHSHVALAIGCHVALAIGWFAVSASAQDAGNVGGLDEASLESGVDSTTSTVSSGDSGCEEECVDSSTWVSPNNEHGCWAYKVGGTNEGYCAIDEAYGPCPAACDSCPECSSDTVSTAMLWVGIPLMLLGLFVPCLKAARFHLGDNRKTAVQEAEGEETNVWMYTNIESVALQMYNAINIVIMAKFEAGEFTTEEEANEYGDKLVAMFAEASHEASENDFPEVFASKFVHMPDVAVAALELHKAINDVIRAWFYKVTTEEKTNYRHKLIAVFPEAWLEAGEHNFPEIFATRMQYCVESARLSLRSPAADGAGGGARAATLSVASLAPGSQLQANQPQAKVDGIPSATTPDGSTLLQTQPVP